MLCMYIAEGYLANVIIIMLHLFQYNGRYGMQGMAAIMHSLFFNKSVHNMLCASRQFLYLWEGNW